MQLLHDLPHAHDSASAAIVDHDGQSFTYGQLCAMIDTMAGALRAHGLRAGDRVMLVCENCATYAVAVLAASKLGAWVSPINARQSADELEAIRLHSGARCMVFTPEASPSAAAHAQRLNARDIATLPCGAILATPADDSVLPEPMPDSPADRIAVLMYTTGTTSAPKGVMLSQSNLLAAAAISAQIRALSPDDDVIAVLPGSHIFCLAAPFLASIRNGATIRFMPRFDVDTVLDALAGGATVFPGVPQMFAAIIAKLGSDTPPSAPRLRYISSGGAPLDPAFKDKIEGYFGLPLHNGYGLTETTSGCVGTTVAKPRADVSVGEPFPGCDIRITDQDDQGVGELQVRGATVMQGYYNNPDATAAAMDGDWFKTGDLAYQDPDGAVHIAGRIKELIIRSGFNVYPPEVEAMLTKHPQVQQAAVVGRPVDGNEEIIAFCIGTGDEAELKAWLHDHLSPYKVPQHIVFVDAFPAAASGKVLKRHLLDEFAHLLNAPIETST